MKINDISKLIATPARMKAINEALENSGCRQLALCGLSGSAPSLLFSGIKSKNFSTTIVICNDADEAGYMYHDLCKINGDNDVLIFPSGYKRDIRFGQPDAPSVILRMEVLNRIGAAKNMPRFVVTYPEALAEKVATSEAIAESTLRFAVGGTADMQEVNATLRNAGFTEVDYVYEPGQYAIRGSILDIFSYANELPYRIDFFGDEIESIRSFNIETQLSEQKIDEIYVLNDTDSSRRTVSFLEYIPADSLLIVRNPQFMLDKIRQIASEKISDSTMITGEGDLNAMDNVINAERFASAFEQFKRITYSFGENADDAADNQWIIRYNFSPQGIYHKNFDIISEAFLKLLADGNKLYILSDSEKQIERLRAIFDDRGDDIPFIPVDSTLHEGFVDYDSHCCIFTDHQIFDRFHRYNLKSDRARSGKLALSLKELSQLSVGDYIVHIDHGVGKFCGLVRTDMNGHMQEMIKISYLNNDAIFVSIHALHKLAKYRGKEGVEPRLNKLGSGAWNSLKEKTKSKLKDIARDLIKLYAERRQEKGFSFSPDSYLQHELEASFIYEDTPDQIKATADVKADMESSRPMDRLICGDVGFGKTEIAIRAAFKAAIDGKQTAVLVPTTVLAYQHFNTFKDRLKDLPVRVDYLSRARKPKDVKQILSDLAEGKIDILIGTHKLIGKEVKFKDLGLLVVDEEQKFGVATKEKLKQLKVNVDTLTLSATPIPRTLQFSLMGARDLTTLTTPPPNRYPILTTVGALSDDVISEAINFEISRNGQIFFINNRIEQLYELESMIHRLVPDARVVVGHGKMPSEQLEKVIFDFVNHDYDILLATTIVESGIDMPNVNTIIVNNAQNFGLSELHQLRGRVGRSSRKAFCYLLIPPKSALSTVAHRRLQAIESFSDLGSGIHIAMQDLDIRGAGNLLGAEQSGFIADLGYETYQKILKEAVLELRTGEFSDSFDEVSQADTSVTDAAEPTYVADCVIESDMELLFPYDYVPQESERISLYQELDNMERDSDVEAFRSRLLDRFGKIPRVSEELIRIVPLRRIAKSLGIEKVVLKQGKMLLFFVGEENQAYYQSKAFGRILNLVQSNPRRCELRQKNGHRSIAVANVTTVEEALSILTATSRLESL